MNKILLGSIKKFDCPVILCFAIRDIKKEYPELADFLIEPGGIDFDKMMDLRGGGAKLYLEVDDE